jgi:hypothetical protein
MVGGAVIVVAPAITNRLAECERPLRDTKLGES